MNGLFANEVHTNCTQHTELIVPSVGYRQPEPSKPVGTAKVVQKVGQFWPKVLENRMLRDVGTVFIR